MNTDTNTITVNKLQGNKDLLQLIDGSNNFDNGCDNFATGIMTEGGEDTCLGPRNFIRSFEETFLTDNEVDTVKVKNFCRDNKAFTFRGCADGSDSLIFVTTDKYEITYRRKIENSDKIIRSLTVVLK